MRTGNVADMEVVTNEEAIDAGSGKGKYVVSQRKDKRGFLITVIIERAYQMGRRESEISFHISVLSIEVESAALPFVRDLCVAFSPLLCRTER